MHFADILEALADAKSEKEALVCGDTRRSWREFEERAARLNSAMIQAGLKPDSKVGFFLYNGNEYCEIYFATLKLRGVAVNINYRYVDEELRYLLDYSDAEALFYDSALADRVANVAADMQGVKLLVEVGAASDKIRQAVPYEKLISSHAAAPRIERSDDDLFMNFTGGTTGMPKGVVYRMGDVSNYLISSVPALLGLDKPIDSIADIVALALMLDGTATPPTSLPACPLMHTAGLMNGFLSQIITGARIVTLPGHSFDPHAMLLAIAREKVSFTVIVGDAFCKPILQALDEARDRGEPYDLSSLKVIISSGVAWSSESKARLLEYADLMLIDAMGATEGGMGLSITSRELPPGETGKFQMMAETRVFDDYDREISAGSGEVGHIAAGGLFVPIAYYKDPEKSAKTFRTIDGKRYAFIGDMGTIEADGTLTVMGRGSGCINTAGEKVFAEEVEAVIAKHPEVSDCLVLGVADPRFGQRVAAIIAVAEDREGLSDSIGRFCGERLAAYKCPRLIRLQASIQRGPNGKADYQWARRLLEQ
jgi:fatty-acyl-CoA synthase